MTKNIAPPSHDAFVAIGAERISDRRPQTAESLAAAQHDLVDERSNLIGALDLALSVALDCQSRWSRGHEDRVLKAKAVLDGTRSPAPITEALRPLVEPRARATEIEWLRWFAQNADFGPAHGDIMYDLEEEFMRRTGKNLPEGWNFGSDGETTLDR